MWILPKQLHTSPYVQDTGELTSDLNEQSQICEQSLLVRSKLMRWQTWFKKWNRDSWTQLLSGRILKPSHGSNFVDAWTSSLEASPVSRSQVPESVGPTVTPDTFSPIFSEESQFADLPLFSSKMSKESSVPNSLGALGETQREHLFCSMSLGNWKEWVIQQRQQYARRLKLVHLTREKECLSWPSVKVSNGGDCPSERRRHTPNLETAVLTDGQQDQEKSNTIGNHQGLQEDNSNKNWQTFAYETHARGETPHRQVVRALVLGEKAEIQCMTVDQVFAEEIKGTNGKQWPTPSVMEGGKIGNQPNHGQLGLSNHPEIVGECTRPKFEKGKNLREEVHQWPTATARDGLGARDGEKRGFGADLNDAVAKYTQQWRSPSASDGEGGVKTGESIEGDDQPKLKLRDHVNHVISTTSKLKLNPDWVCTLMGVPIGWVKATPEGSRVDELRLLGNGVVPATCEKAFKILAQALRR